MLIAIISIIIGLTLLIWSADRLVEHASIFALNLGISTFLVGIIIIGFGTSAPELFVSALAALENKGNLALGNALGSNITNIGLVLGSAALISTMQLRKQTITKDIPMVILSGIIAVALIWDGLLSTIDGIILLGLLIGFLIWSAKQSSEPPEELDDIEKTGSTALHLAWTVGSIILLVAASKLLVNGAIYIAQEMGISELIIGLTIVAIGTSLPELAAAVAAARKNAHDMIIGNIIGSNIFNTLGVLGLTGVMRATDIDTNALWRDFPIMFTFTLALLVFGLIKQRFGRFEGIVLLLAYASYVCYLSITTLS